MLCLEKIFIHVPKGDASVVDHPSTQEATSSTLCTNQPCLYIYTLGSFHMEWVNETGQRMPLSIESGQRRGLSSALTLLKFLVCQDHRFALCDTIIANVFTKDEKPLCRLDNVASRLRFLLRSPQQERNLVGFTRRSIEQGKGYHLAPYPHIWVDADAAAWNVEQASLLERFGENAFPFWEAAAQLYMRGIYLPDELGSDWSQTRRAIQHGHYRQCVHRFSHLLWDHGAHEEALFRLRIYWITYPTDEDALRFLMSMLTEQERYHEALEYYERLQTCLAQIGREPHPLTQDLAAYARVKPIQNARLTTHSFKKEAERSL